MFTEKKKKNRQLLLSWIEKRKKKKGDCLRKRSKTSFIVGSRIGGRNRLAHQRKEGREKERKREREKERKKPQPGNQSKRGNLEEDISSPVPFLFFLSICCFCPLYILFCFFWLFFLQTGHFFLAFSFLFLSLSLSVCAKGKDEEIERARKKDRRKYRERNGFSYFISLTTANDQINFSI